MVGPHQSFAVCVRCFLSETEWLQVEDPVEIKGTGPTIGAVRRMFIDLGLYSQSPLWWGQEFRTGQDNNIGSYGAVPYPVLTANNANSRLS